MSFFRENLVTEYAGGRWGVIQNRRIFRERVEYSTTGKETLLSVSKHYGVKAEKDLSEDEQFASIKPAESLVGYKKVCEGDLVMNIMRAQNGSYGIAGQNGIVSPAYCVYEPIRDYSTRYVEYLYKTPNMIRAFYANSYGIAEHRRRLYPQNFLNMYTVLPPRAEQDQIVRFLDWKVSEINRLIALKRKELMLLSEYVQKQFGDLSECAEIRVRLKYLVSLSNEFVSIEKGKFYWKTGMYNRGRGIFRREPMLGEDMGDSKFQRIRSGCVMISGQFAWEAATYVTSEEDEIGVASHRYYLLVPQEGLPSEYIWCFLISDYGQMLMKLCSHGAAGRNRPLNIKELLNVYMPVPTQCKELDSLVNNVKRLMALRRNLNEQEKLLAECRNRLISDVVTGKIDVRDIEIPEYEFVDEAADSDAEDGDDAEGTEEQEE